MQPSDIEHPKRKKNVALRNKSNKPPVIKNEVVIRRALGQNKSMIARELGIAQNTVTNILGLNNIDDMIQDGRLSVARLIPKSVNVLDQRLDRCSESAATTILSGIGVLRSKQDVNVNVAVATSNSWYQRRNADRPQLQAAAGEIIEADPVEHDPQQLK